MDYTKATGRLLSDFEQKPELLEGRSKSGDSRAGTISQATSEIAPNYILPGQPVKFGQLAQGLSDWHTELKAQCSERYKALTDTQSGPGLSKQEANQDEQLQTLQAIKRGVRAARNIQYENAKNNSFRLQRLPSLLPFMAEEAAFTGLSTSSDRLPQG